MRRVRGRLQLLVSRRLLALSCDRHMRIGTCEMPLRSRLCALLALICGVCEGGCSCWSLAVCWPSHAIGTCESAHAKCHCGLGSARSWLSCAACARAAAAAGLSSEGLRTLGSHMRRSERAMALLRWDRHMRNATAVSALRALGSHVRRVRGRLQLLVSCHLLALSCDRHMRIGTTCEMPLRSRLCAL